MSIMTYKMSILDKTKVGNIVQVNLELSKDRLSREIIDAIKTSSVGKIKDFKITDGKGLGVILQLSNGKEQWFFEVVKELKYEDNNKISELLNPINFFLWLIVSLKDIF